MTSYFNALTILAIGIIGLACTTAGAEEEKPVTFSGGHETDRRDHGRPVVLVAAALGVKTEEFRKAFSGVTPARNGRPSPEEARASKAALMKVLAPLGVDNDRLDEVSNYYRYQPQRGKLWKNTPAKAHAVVENGVVKRVVVDEPGSGYSTSPLAKFEGMDGVELKVTLMFDKDLKKNGSIAAVEIVKAEK